MRDAQERDIALLFDSSGANAEIIQRASIYSTLFFSFISANNAVAIRSIKKNIYKSYTYLVRDEDL